MNKLRISAISYLNTTPFVYGIKNSGFLKDYEFTFDVPSTCAQKLIEGSTDIGIVPVAAIPEIPGATITTNYCIGARGPVKTVLLVSLSPLESIHTIYLDPDSRTSVKLVGILAEKYWKQKFIFNKLSPEVWQNLRPGTGAVVIGDKTFGLEKVFPYRYDLAEHWVNFSNLPFVFACWISRNPLPETIREQFSNAIEYGIQHIDQMIPEIDTQLFPDLDLHAYFTKNLSYSLDKEKLEGMNLFLSYIREYQIFN